MNTNIELKKANGEIIKVELISLNIFQQVKNIYFIL